MREIEVARLTLDAAFVVHKTRGGLKLGLLINFGEAQLKNGIKRVINGRIEEHFEL